MNGKRILGIVCAGILASSLSGLVACSANTDKEVPTSQAVQAATVSISMVDAKGNKVQGTGVLIAPRLVLTSGHLISGMSKWSVTNGKTTVTGSRGLTYDWLAYTDRKAHPRKHDIGVIHLDESIKLDAYPRIVASKSADGTKATRIRGTGGGNFEMKDTVLGRVKTAPSSYLADMGSETLDTGGAVFDDRGIIGIVSGKGMTTGKLYIARTDRLTKWLSPKVACAGGSLGTRTYAEQQHDKSQAVCEDAGGATSNNGGNGGNNGGGNGPTAGGDSCAGDNNGYCSGNCVGNFPGGANVPGANGGPSASSSESNGANPNGGPGGSGANGGPSASNGESNGANPSGGGGANNGGSAGSNESNGANPSGGGGTNGASGGSNESNGANPNGGAAGGGGNGSDESNGASHSGGAGAGVSGSPGTGADGDDEGCQGAGDNLDLCPFEGDLTTWGPNQGGGHPDWDIDYTLPLYGGSSGGGDNGGLKVN